MPEANKTKELEIRILNIHMFNNNYSVTIPREAVEMMGLKKGQRMKAIVQKDGSNKVLVYRPM